MEDSVKQNLQERLLDAVKQCQTHFGGRQEVATESDLRASTLCLEWEAVLSHGHKKPKTNKLLSGFTKVDNLTGVALWPVIRPFVSNEEKDRFARLRFINSDIGRGRAWLRAAINERTLETYLHSLLSDRNHLKSFYESHSFLLDEERSTMLPVMAAGLSSIIFSLTVDGDYLNSPLKIYEVPQIDPALRPTSSSTVTASIKPSFALRFSGDSSIATSDNDVVAVSNKKTKKKKRKTPSPDIEATPTNNYNVINNHFDLTTPIDAPPTSLGLVLPSDVCNISPASTDGLRCHGDDTPVIIDPVISPGSSNSSPVGSIQSINSEDNNTLFNPRTALDSTAAVIEATQALPTSSVATAVPKATVSVATVMSEEEMKEALKVLVKSKENIEEEYHLVQTQLTSERERVRELEKELNEMTLKLHSTDEAHSQQQLSLERENDLLREQLKRYVGLVKQQKDEEEEGGEGGEVGQKLSEMAEMYGELMEFNEHLHKSVQTKDTLIVKLVHTLKLAAIPLPVSSELLPRQALEPAKIVEVWIPSVIKRGRGPESHHEYQVYVKLGNEEWNVYRRFAEMYEFHRQLLRNLQGVEEFEFPPKKVIGNKGSQLIEERRQKLQQYLRFVLELCCRPVIKRKDGRTNNAYVTEGMSKEQFVKVLPFFNDSTNSNTNTHKLPVQRSYSGL